MKKDIISILFVSVFLVSSCSLSFEYVTDTLSVKIPNGYAFYQELSYEMPKEAYGDASSYEKVVVYFTAEKDTGYTANFKIYAYLDSIPDTIKSESGELLMNVQMDSMDTFLSDSAESVILRNSLDYNEVILGFENLATGDSLDVTNIDARIKITGTYSEVK